MSGVTFHFIRTKRKKDVNLDRQNVKKTSTKKKLRQKKQEMLAKLLTCSLSLSLSLSLNSQIIDSGLVKRVLVFRTNNECFCSKI